MSFSSKITPKKLSHQLILVVVTLLSLSMALSIWFFTQFQTNSEITQLHRQLGQVSHSLSSNSDLFYNFNKNKVLHALLLQAVEFPQVLQIDVSNQMGESLISAKRDDATQKNPPYLITDPITVKLEQPGSYRLTNSRMIVWSICRECTSQTGKNYWVRIVADATHINQNRQELISTLLLYAVILVFLITDAFIIYNARSMKQLSKINEFALTLSQSSGVQLNLSASSIELQNITDTLNRLSKHWFHMQELAASSQFKIKMKNNILDEHALVCITDPKGIIQDVNDLFCSVSQYNKHELIGRHSSMLKAGVQGEEHYKLMWRLLSVGRVWHGEFCNRKKNGDLYWVKATVTPITDDTGKLLFFAAAQTEISYLKQTRDSQQVAG